MSINITFSYRLFFPPLAINFWKRHLPWAPLLAPGLSYSTMAGSCGEYKVSVLLGTESVPL